MSLAILMQKLVTCQLPYVAVSGYNGILEKKLGGEPKLAILVTKETKPAIVTYLQATSASKVRNNADYLVPVSSGNAAIIMPLKIYEKGNGLYSERFESELLNSRVVKGNMIHAPSRESEVQMTLYNIVVHQGRLDGPERRILLDHLKDRIGLVKPKYNDISYFPDSAGASTTNPALA